MKSARKLGIASIAVIGLTVGAVVSLGGGKLFETGGNGGWFTGLFSSDAVTQTAQPSADTRLADQTTTFPVRSPIAGQEDIDSALSRMASLPYVTSDDALAGAIAGDAPGMAKLQAYLDAAGFDAEALEARTDILFSALEADRDLAYTREETRSAARRIVSAARLSAGSAYMFPVALFDTYALGQDAMGWDIGPGGKQAYQDFIRSADNNTLLGGEQKVYYADEDGISLFSDGATDFTSIRIPSDRTDDLRLFALSATERTQGGPYPLPFGYSISSSGQPYRIVDGRKATSAPWVSMTSNGVVLHTTRTSLPLARSALNDVASGEEGTASADIRDDKTNAASATNPSNTIALGINTVRGYNGLTFAQAGSTEQAQRGTVLSLPIKSINGRARLDLDQLSGQSTLASAFILGPDTMAPVLARVAERARALESAGALVAGLPKQSAGTNTPQSAPKEPTGFLAVGTIDYPTALAGALSGNAQGIRNLGAYMDAAGGDLSRLETRALALVDGLEARTQVDDFLTLAEAANRITDATAKAASTTYLMNGFIGRDFDLPDPEAGWDFGANESLPFSGFTRSSPVSDVVIGANARPGSNPISTPLVKDFIARAQGFKFNLPSAYYRVLMLVAPAAGDSGPSPVGQSMSINGNDQRLRDLRASSPQVWSRLAGGSISLHGGLESYGPVDPMLEDMLEIDDGMQPLKDLMMRGGVYSKLPTVGQDVDRNATLGDGQRNTVVFASRAFVNSAGGMIIDFPNPPDGGTVVGALIQGESNPEPLAERLAERIARLLGSTAPASGLVLDEILPAAGSFFSNSFNLPTQVAANLNSQTRYVNGGGIGPVGGGALGTLAETDAGVTDTDAGVTDTDAGVTDTDTGGTDTDTGGTDTDTGGTDTDTGGTDTDTGGTDTDTGGTDTDTGGTDTDTGGTDTDTGGTDTDTGGTDTDTGGTDTDTGGTDTDTGGTDTDTGGTDTDTGGTDTDTGGTDTDTGGTDTDTGGTDTDTGGTDTDTGGTDTDTGGTDTDTGGTDTDTGGTDTDTGGTDTDTGGTDTDTGGTDTDTGGTDTDTGGTDTDTGGTDTDTGGTDTDTGGTDTDTGGTDTDTGGTDTDTGGTDTDTGGTDTDTGGTDTDTGGTDTDTGGTDTDSGGTDTDTGGTDTDTGGTDTDTGGTDTDTGGTDTDTGGTDTDTGGTDTDTGGTDTDGGEVMLEPNAGGPYRVSVGEEFALDGSASVFDIDLDEFDIEWILFDLGGMEMLRVTGLGTTESPLDTPFISLDEEGRYDVTLSFRFEDIIATADTYVLVVAGTEIPVPAAIALFIPGAISLLAMRRRRRSQQKNAK